MISIYDSLAHRLETDCTRLAATASLTERVRLETRINIIERILYEAAEHGVADALQQNVRAIGSRIRGWSREPETEVNTARIEAHQAMLDEVRSYLGAGA